MAQNGELQIHPAFEGAGKAPGMEVWRIEKFEPVKQEPKSHGVFFNGDSYIILNTKKRPGARKFEYNLHFWLGKNTSQDESGTAAIRTVELDDMVLNGAAVQYREVQGHESRLFLGYFKKGIKYLEGGVESGFNKIEDLKPGKRLYHVKGQRRVRVEQVECKCSSLNQGDVFILDSGPTIFAWIGPKSGKMERLKGINIARAIRDDEKAGKGNVVIIEKDWHTNEEFFKALGSKDKTIRPADLSDSDSETERRAEEALSLYRFTETASGKPEVTEVTKKPLKRSHLKSDNCYVLDSGVTGIYVWTGKECTTSFKLKVWKMVNTFLEKRGYPDWLSVVRVTDGGETPLFKQYFSQWVDPATQKDKGDTENKTAVNEADKEFDATQLHEKPETVEQFMPDDGTGKKEVYRIENFELAPIPEVAHGIFFAGDSYVIHYKYKAGRDEKHIIYFWQGLKSTTDEKGASALQAVRLDDELGGRAVQIRVVMNKEPAHFLRMFEGRVLYFMGGSASGFRNVHDREDYDPKKPMMFHVRGADKFSTRAIQVDCRAASLNSNDLFLVETGKKVYAWIGKGASDQEKELASMVCEYVSPERGDPIVIQEGEETKVFWDTIGGKEPYYTGPRKKDFNKIDARLFHCSVSSGRFWVEELTDFDQEDLDESDVMILDTYDEIFVWIGKDSRPIEKKESAKTAYTYLNTDPTGRTPDNTMIIIVHQGFEPPQFTGHFHPWDADKWNKGKTFQEIMEEVGEENARIGTLEEEVKKYTSFYTYEELKRKIPPEGVDVTVKEAYLTDEDFQNVFGMTKDQFEGLPEWKRINKKREVNLF